MSKSFDYRKVGQRVLETELAALRGLQEYMNEQFNQACELMLHCSGKVIVMGMGKSGHIARKMAATFASTGTAAFFVHPGEASHGDLGMISAQDVVIAISNSGESSEILALLPVLKRWGNPLICMTSNPNSTMANESDIPGRSLPVRPGANIKHHSHAGNGGCPGCRPARSSRLHQ